MVRGASGPGVPDVKKVRWILKPAVSTRKPTTRHFLLYGLAWALLTCSQAGDYSAAAWVAHWRARRGSSVDSCCWTGHCFFPEEKLRTKQALEKGRCFRCSCLNCWGMFQFRASDLQPGCWRCLEHTVIFSNYLLLLATVTFTPSVHCHAMHWTQLRLRIWENGTKLAPLRQILRLALIIFLRSW